ncbi:transcriptional regulator [Streptomyces antioxidans]|uniref:Transcriptional regulator n=1 Tax=Streptomyces antioxidans TaxID=1507734 RepID=A0A1V4D6L1_9ACTN|nr:helix-turn-helix domain-containing protein [Streptomyces antioxidans]OPF80403.1 transcriptional regulator [Streptomyces antioxidans]
MTSSSTTPDEPAEERERDVRLDTARLRVLAHPVRLNVLTLLRQRGPATATRIADELGINPGSASYHLRRLAAGGLIVEEPDRGTGRERWWRSAHRQSIHDPATEPVEQSEAGRAYAQAVVLACVDRLQRAAQEVPLLPAEWYEASTFGDFVLRLSPADVERVRAEIFEVISRHRRAEVEASPAAVPVSLQVQAFPVPGTVELGAGDT